MEHKRPLRLVMMLGVISACCPASGAGAEYRPISENWHDTKCARYRAAWSAALDHVGSRGLGRDFLARHEAFLASNCMRDSDVCPKSKEELDLANRMVMMSMNFGAASTFAPFYCR